MISRRMKQAAQQGVHWWIMRIATSDDFHDTYSAIAHRWSFHDQLMAHMTLDCLDEVRAIQRPPLKADK